VNIYNSDPHSRPTVWVWGSGLSIDFARGPYGPRRCRFSFLGGRFCFLFRVTYSASGSRTAEVLGVWLEYVNGRTGRLSRKDTQREIFVADKLLRQTPGAAISGIDVKLVGNHRGEMGSWEEREKGLPKLGLLLL
ncbi:MAG: hypothetical protein ACREQA_07960, partial [Candidatus Binatia bacterium]